MRILVHICCAPCFTYPHKQLLKQGHEITGFFYNPNIHPYTEYMKRKKSLEKFVEMNRVKVLYINKYELEDFLRKALEAEDRCRFCYTYRLAETAKTSSLLGFDAFTTTLLLSPYQKHEMLAKVGETVAERYGVEFYYEDFRKGYKQSRELAKNCELYMQKYCGCIFSEKQRYYKKKFHM